MKATSDQKRIIQIECKKNQYDGYKDELVQWATDDNSKTSCNDLSFDQANAVLVRLGKPKHFPSNNPEGLKYARFDKDNSKHMRILATCITIGWWKSHPRFDKTADLERLGKWLMSDKSPVQKPLSKMTPAELSKIITALDIITVKKYSK